MSSVEKMYLEILQREKCPKCGTQNTKQIEGKKRKCNECNHDFEWG